MFRLLSRFILLRLFRWKIIGTFPQIPKCVVVVFPHTSNYDFLLGIMTRSIIREEVNYVAKKELFNPFTSWFFKGLGGAPIDRKKNQNLVDNIVEIYNTRNTFRLAIAPEGTRKAVKKWKTGFYYIAKGANVPIQLVAFDYPKREVVFYPLFNPTNDTEKDFAFMESQFKGVYGKVKENSILSL